jgi:TetR/AcrR family transcriptional regulator, acrAB operon repressor
MVRKTKEEAQETRNAILDAAERVFQERGVSHTSLAEIAAEAGVTRGAIYWHFANKSDVFDALFERVFAPLEERFVALHEELRRNERVNPLEHIRKMALDFIGRVVSDPRYFRLIEISWHKCEYVGEMATIRDNHLECGNRHLEMAVESFRLAQDRDFLPASLDPRIAAMGLVALIDGLVVNFTLERSTFPLAGYAPAILDAYLAGLTVVPPTVSVAFNVPSI